jgi:alanine dehydrogenase
MADHSVLEAGRRNQAIRHGLNTYDGHITHPAVAEALRMKCHSPWESAQ